MTGELDNAEWQRQNDQWRSPKARRPDVHYITFAKKGSAVYVILADGWEAKCKRRQKWIPTDKVNKPEIDSFGREEAAKLAKLRGLSSADGAGNKDQARDVAKARKSKLDCILEEALSEIEADKSASENDQTAGNTGMGCRVIRAGLPPDRLQVPVRRLTPKEFERHVKARIVEHPDWTVDTKKQYLNQARAVCKILAQRYGLDPGCEKALRAPTGMTGGKSDERPFTDPEIQIMEREIEGERIHEVLGEWTEVIQGVYYWFTSISCQPVDVVFRTHEEFGDEDASVSERRRKTSKFFNGDLSFRFEEWRKRRRKKGGVWAEGHIFPELVFGIRACQKSTGPLKILTPTQQEAAFLNITGRLRDYFDKFLEEVCEIKRPGLNLSSFRHYILPYLRSQGVPDDVGMDYAGQVTPEAYRQYTRRATPQERQCVAAMITRHLRNVKEGIRETFFLTLRDLGCYLKKVTWKCTKKILQAVQSSTTEILRELRQVEYSQGTRMDALEAKLDAFLATAQQPHEPRSERVIAIGARILSFAPIQGLGGRECAARPDAQTHNNNASTALNLDSYSI